MYSWLMYLSTVYTNHFILPFIHIYLQCILPLIHPSIHQFASTSLPKQPRVVPLLIHMSIRHI